LTVQAKLQADDVPAMSLSIQPPAKGGSFVRPSFQKPGKR